MAAGIIRNMLNHAGVRVNGDRPWDIQVYNRKLYTRVFNEKNLGLGESYMDGWWDCERIDEFIHRLLNSDLECRIRGNLKYIMRQVPALVFNLQSALRSRIIADRHYDLGNELFFSFLDPYYQYSCAYFKNTDSLNQAQQNKLNLIAGKLELKSDDHLLDIGSGWGGLARYMAESTGCRVTGVNISKRQLEFSREFCAGLPVEFKDQDYRDIQGKFDKIVSVGMFEHVGLKNYQAFMNTAYSALKKDGIFLLHTIGGNKSKKGCDQWITRYIFPNGMLPSMAQIAQHSEGLFILEDVHNLGPHYDRTLMKWSENFQKNWPELKNKTSKYDERFKRMWEYYLLSCAGAFRARNIQLWQVVFTRKSSTRPQPECRLG